MGSTTVCGDGTSLYIIQAKFKPTCKGESDQIEKGNDSSDYPEQHGMKSSLVAAPPGNGSWGHFLSVTVNEEPSSRANDPWYAITPTSTY